MHVEQSQVKRDQLLSGSADIHKINGVQVRSKKRTAEAGCSELNPVATPNADLKRDSGLGEPGLVRNMLANTYTKSGIPASPIIL